jgi:Flp pilus assembly pilin Flp
VLRRFLSGEETAASIVEYALALLLICVVSVAVISAFGTAISNVFLAAATSI